MDIQTRLLLRLFMWFRKPPSRQQLWIIGITLVIAIGIGLIEFLFGWPEALTVDGGGRVLR